MTRPIRALLLAAGLGTRLRPITAQMPKCLVKVAGEPLLSRWLHQLEEIGCEAVLINTHYLSDQVEAFLQKRAQTTMRVETVHEPVLLGTAGTLLTNSSFFKDSTGLLIHADNAMNESLKGFLSSYENRPKDCLLTMLTFFTNQPNSCGIVTTDKNGIVKSFHEKVRNPPGNCANGAVYSFDQNFLDYCRSINPLPTDFSTEILPHLMGRINTWQTSNHYLDIGTPSALIAAQKLIAPLGGI